MPYFKNALLFGDQIFSSGDHFTKGSRQKATSEKPELGALTKGVLLTGDSPFILEVIRINMVTL